jgi:hypothetical protein
VYLSEKTDFGKDYIEYGFSPSRLSFTPLNITEDFVPIETSF